jgi:gliding motility-associated-like protein
LFITDFGNNRIQKYKHFITVVDTVLYPKKTGMYYATLTDTAGCTFVTDTVSVTSLAIPSVNISAQDTTICAGMPVTFTANVSGPAINLNYLWKLNNDSTGTNRQTFITDSIATGDSVFCIISPKDGCANADTSNSIYLKVNPIPIFGPSANITIPLGNSTPINIPVQGNVASYTWTPDYYLSATSIPSPIASPNRSTTYYLTVVSASDGCPATDSITVNVTSNIYIPSAFTPNADGKNDILYVLGGLPGDIIKDFTVFDRWGKRVFQLQNVLPNYRNYGWDGNTNGYPAPTGSYIYTASILSANGKETVYKGSVVLLR